MNEPSLLAQYNAAGRKIAEMELQLGALRGENLLLKTRLKQIDDNFSDNHGSWCYNS